MATRAIRGGGRVSHAENYVIRIPRAMVYTQQALPTYVSAMALWLDLKEDAVVARGKRLLTILHYFGVAL